MLPSHCEGLRTAYLGPRAEWNLKILGKYDVIEQLSETREKSYKARSATRRHHDGDGRGTVGGKKGVKVRTGSSYAENARSENLEGIRRRRVWPEDAVNGRGFTKGKEGLAHPTAAEPRSQEMCNVSHCSASVMSRRTKEDLKKKK
jgi:hypothetical protein